MHSAKAISIILLLVGIAALTIGLVIYWFSTPVVVNSSVTSSVSPWASVLVLMGILLMLGAIIFLCIGIHYELEDSIYQMEQSAQQK